MRQAAKLAIVAALLLAHGSTFALGKLSRACRFSDISATLKTPALVLFAYLGMPTQLLNLPSRPLREQEDHYILESITTDYGSLRYYLFAENRIYRVKNPWTVSSDPRWELDGQWFQEAAYKSPWAAESLDPRIFPDSRLSVFSFNRRVMFSARAGHSSIVQYYSRLNPWGKDLFRVIGHHFYYDPVGKVQGDLGRTDVDTCNLSQWGLEDR